MKDAQRRVAEFVHAHDLSAGVETRLLDLVSELGELAKEGLKGTDYGSVAILAAAVISETTATGPTAKALELPNNA